MNPFIPFRFSVLLCLVSATAIAAESESRDLRLVVDGSLFEQETASQVATLHYELPGMEWRGQDGAWNLELGSGSGHADVKREDGITERVPLEVRMTRYPADAELLPDGSRMWPYRGDLYLISRKYPLVEGEFDLRILLPPTGATTDNGALPVAQPGEGWHPLVVRMMASLPPLGRGGGLLYGLNVPLWGRKVPTLTYMGYLFVSRISAKPSKKSATERDGEILLGRIQYVSADYPRAVDKGEIISQAEYAEQVRLLTEARVLCDRLAVPQTARAKLDAIRQLVDNRGPADMVMSASRELTQELLRSLWFSLTPPEPGSQAEGARLFATSCAVCHGAQGDGNTPRARELDPPPAPFARAEFVANLSPFRAFTSITGGMAGTAMPAFESSLSAKERWSLAFYVYSFQHKDGGLAGREALARNGVSVPIEELALETDAELSARLATELPAAAVPPALAYLRTQGVAHAAESPLYAVRRRLQAVAKLYGRDPALARSEMHSAEREYAALAPRLHVRDEEEGRRGRRVLEELSDRVAGGAAEADVRAAALRAVDVLSDAEPTLAKAPRRGFPAFLAVLLETSAAIIWAMLVGLLFLTATPRWAIFVGGGLGVMTGMVLAVPTPVQVIFVGTAGAFVALSLYRHRKPPIAGPYGILACAFPWMAVHVAVQRAALAFRPWWTESTGDRTAVVAGFAASVLLLGASWVLASRVRRPPIRA
jgi:high-affinity iron transporter